MEAVQSILRQTNTNFRFVVSDNSTNRLMEERMKAEFPAVEYISRFPGVSASDHFRAVMALVETPYYVMFHDDDLMEPGYVDAVLRQFEQTPEAAAVATNASLIDGEGTRIGNSTSFTAHRRQLTFSTPSEFLLHYLSGDRGGVAPFCTYAYNARAILGLSVDFERVRNYCDTVFLAKVVSRGPVIWLNEPLVDSRVHESNDSNVCGARDYKAFVALVRKDYAGVVKEKQLEEYRCLRLFVTLERRRRLPWPAVKFFLRVFPRLLATSPSFRRRVFTKLRHVAARKRTRV